jgi:Peptidase S46
MLTAYSARSDENAREAKELLFYVQNSRKARDGGLAGLLDPPLLARKEAEEKVLHSAVASRADLKDVLSAWDRIAGAQKTRAEILHRFTVLEGDRLGPAGFAGTYFEVARTLVRAAEERPKLNGERLREFRDSNRPSLELDLFSEEPIYDNYERARLASSLTFLAEELGYTNDLVQEVLAGKSPEERASHLVRGTHLKDIALRKQLYEGGLKAIDASTDSMIALAKLVDPAARAVRKIMETEVEEVSRQAYAQIARAKYAIEGPNTYPDATFTLRLAFGVVKGYEENGQQIPFETNFAGLYLRAKEHHNQPPFNLPPRWVERKDKLDLNTPFNFVCTADSIGGNSGSPVINRNAEVVGLLFDGNIQSLVLDFIYTEKQARTVAVHSQGIVEALRKIYDAEALADELTRKK